MNGDRFYTALASASPFDALLALAWELKGEGRDQEAMYSLFDAVRAELHENEGQKYDAVLDVMDIISGHCTPEKRLYADKEND